MLYAATFPERVRGLVLCGAFARMTTAHDHPYGYRPEDMDRLKSYIRKGWGKGASLRPIAPMSMREDPEFLDWVAFAEQEGTSPGGALDLLDMNINIDLRALLPTIRVPTAVLQADADRMIDPGCGRYLADHIPNARYVEVPGSDHVFFFRTQEAILGAVEWILEQQPPTLEEDRFLSTVLAGQPPIDEAVWQDHVRRFRGQPIPGKQLAYFDGPIRALRCGAALADRSGGSFGVHTGPVSRYGATVGGPAFEIAEAIAGKPPPGQVWASRVLVDLVPGSDLRFEETGESIGVQDREIALLSLRAKG